MTSPCLIAEVIDKIDKMQEYLIHFARGQISLKPETIHISLDPMIIPMFPHLIGNKNWGFIHISQFCPLVPLLHHYIPWYGGFLK